MLPQALQGPTMADKVGLEIGACLFAILFSIMFYNWASKRLHDKLKEEPVKHMTNLGALRVALDTLQTSHERNMKYHEYVVSKESAAVALAIASLERSIQQIKEAKCLPESEPQPRT